MSDAVTGKLSHAIQCYYPDQLCTCAFEKVQAAVLPRDHGASSGADSCEGETHGKYHGLRGEAVYHEVPGAADHELHSYILVPICAALGWLGPTGPTAGAPLLLYLYIE